MTRHKDNEGWDGLAESLGFTVRQVHRWRKLEGSPATADLEAWRRFISAQGLGKDRGSPTLNQLKEEKLSEEIALLRLKRARDEGATVLVSDVREFLGQMAARHAQLLRMKYDTELPVKLAGKDIVGIRQVTSATTDEVAEVVSRGLLEWNPGS